MHGAVFTARLLELHMSTHFGSMLYLPFNAYFQGGMDGFSTTMWDGVLLHLLIVRAETALWVTGRHLEVATSFSI